MPDFIVNRHFKPEGKAKAKILCALWMRASENDEKIILLDLIQRTAGKKASLRLRYHVIGKNGRMKGKWAFGQFATVIMPKDLQKLTKLARKHRML